MSLNVDEKSALKSFKTHLEDVLGNGLVDLKLFGSKARGDDTPFSDLDVLAVVADEDWQISDTVYGVATEVLLQTGICISPKVISQKRLEKLSREDSSFVRNVQRDAVTV
jgi:predicted nucleotidyltransferase